MLGTPLKQAEERMRDTHTREGSHSVSTPTTYIVSVLQTSDENKRNTLAFASNRKPISEPANWAHNAGPESNDEHHATGRSVPQPAQPTPPHIHGQQSTKLRSPTHASIGAKTTAADHSSSRQTNRCEENGMRSDSSSSERLPGTRKKQCLTRENPDLKRVGGASLTQSTRAPWSVELATE